MFDSLKNSMGWRLSAPVIGMCLFFSCAPAQAGLFDAITEGIGNLGGKSSTSEPAISSNRPPPDPASFKPVEPTVKAENLEALPGTKKIILANFVVEFQQRYEKTKAGFSLLGMGNAGSSTAINDVTLPDQNTLQLITNFAYLDVLKKLKEKGYEVIEVSALSDKAKPPYEKMTKSAFFKPGDKLDNVDGDSVLYGPDGMTPVYPFMGCGHYEPEKKLSKFGAGMTATGRNYAVSSNAQMENEIALAEGDIPVLKVWYTVGFGDVDAKGGNAFVSARQNDYLGTTTTTVANSSNANATGGMFLKPDVSRFSILLPSHESMRALYKQNCTMKFGNFDKRVPPPVDGDVLIRLADKYHDDGDKVLSMSSQAGTVGITDRAIGGGIGIRSVKENNDGTQAQSSDNGNGVQLALKGSSTSGTVDAEGMRTHLHTTSEYATSIRSDVYATSAATMIYKVSDAFVSKLP